MDALGARGGDEGVAVAVELLGLAAVVGQLLALFPPGPANWTEYSLSWALLGVVALFVARFGRHTQWWAGAAIPAGYLAAATILLQSEGTARTGLNLLLLLPVLWSSLNLRPWKSAVTVAAAIGLEAHLLVTASTVSGYVIARSLVLWTLVGSFMALSTHTLRSRLERANALALEAARVADALATTDSMTGLLNRRGLEQAVTHGRHRHPFTVFALDLDGLKQVNDQHGHAAGDQLIQTFAATVRTQLRSSDALARVGGDEFLAVVFDSAELDVDALARKVLSAAGETIVAGQPMRSSIGVAGGDDGDNFEEVVRRADDALYAAKKSGGGQYLSSDLLRR